MRYPPPSHSNAPSNRNLLLALFGAGAYLFGREMFAREHEADLSGQVALITGGSRGLGLLIARELGRMGCKIAVCARDAEELSRAREDLDQYAAEVVAIPCDMTDREQVKRVVNQVTRHYGQIDILVNNAGVITVGPLVNTKLEDFEEAMNVIYWGTLYATLSVLPQMRARKSGRIVNITSVGGKVAVPHLAAYSAAKFAATGLSEVLHAELAQEGITVTTICPGILRDGAQVNSYFTGNQESEYSWFSLGASLPFSSLNADEAARQIVQATRRGEAERVLGAPAKVLSFLHGLFPQATIEALGLMNRFLLPKPGGKVKRRGMDIQDEMQDTPLTAVTRLGLDAGQRNNEYPGPTETLDQ